MSKVNYEIFYRTLGSMTTQHGFLKGIAPLKWEKNNKPLVELQNWTTISEEEARYQQFVPLRLKHNGILV